MPLSLFVEFEFLGAFWARIWKGILVCVCCFYMCSNISFERGAEVTALDGTVVHFSGVRFFVLPQVSYTHEASGAGFTEKRRFIFMYYQV